MAAVSLEADARILLGPDLARSGFGQVRILSGLDFTIRSILPFRLPSYAPV